MNRSGLIPSVLGSLAILMFSCPVEAAQLQFWRFNAPENRLIFTTDENVRPRAQLIQNPTRIVIDLPGVRLGNTQRNQPVGGAIREVRVIQLDAQTARLIIELNSGYTINPQHVVVQGSTPTQWVVQLPEPQTSSNSSENVPASSQPASEPMSVVEGAATRLDGVRITQNGLFLETAGNIPEIDIDRSRRRRRITLELENTALSVDLEEEIDLNQFGVNTIRFEQEDDDPPTVEVTLQLEDNSTNWQASTNFGGIALVPVGQNAGTAIAPPQQSPPPRSVPTPSTTPAPSNSTTPAITTIRRIELANNGTQLRIQSTDPIQTYTAGWDRATTDFQIVIPNARLADSMINPRLRRGGPLLRIYLREENNTVIVSLAPAAGVQLGDVIQPGREFLVLGLRGNPVAAPGFIPNQSAQLPRVAGQTVVVIDPGHGGRDPGAIGIGGLRETNVVLPISLQVANLLQQQGVRVVMTRNAERTVELEGRVQIAERANADLFVSIHANAINMSRPDVNGIETYYASAQGHRLARAIHDNLLRAVGGPDRGVKQARFYVIRRTSMPAALVETGFVTGAQDAPNLRNAAYQQRIAEAIARGILQYIQRN